MKVEPSRAVALGLGVVASSLSAYGAYEMQRGLEAEVTYLTIAAPFVVATAAIIPPLAEVTWRNGSWFKAFLWWLVLIPTAALAFFAARERVQIAKGGAAAERAALHSAATRAEQDLGEAKGKVTLAEADEKAARDLKKCKEECLAKWEAATAAAREREALAAEALTRAQARDVAAPEEVPAWLLPACLDLVAFMAIWTGFAPARVRKGEEIKAKKKRRMKRTIEKPAKAVPNVAAIKRQATNDNVVYLPAA